MGRVASAGDNAAIESFWALLQRNVLNTGPWRNRAELHYAITYWIDHTTTEEDANAGSDGSPRSSSS